MKSLGMDVLVVGFARNKLTAQLGGKAMKNAEVTHGSVLILY